LKPSNQHIISLPLLLKMPLSKENQMQMAISAYKKGQFKSKATAAEVFRVSRETLHDQLRGIKPRAETRANSYKLIAFEEEVLAKHLLDADRHGFSIQPQFLCGMAQILLCAWTNDPTSVIRVNWAYKFIKRHPALHTRYNQRISYQRAKQEDLKIIKQWFELIHTTIQEHSIHEDDI
jgi:hypothetical protein